MSVSSPFKDLNDFLAKHSAKNEPVDRANISPTHTRIPDKDLNVYGGSYIIPAEDLPIFYKLYYESVFVKNRKEHLTERQLCNNGPIALDLDFRYNYDVETTYQNPRSRFNKCNISGIAQRILYICRK